MFLPDLEDEVLDIAMMQRMTDWAGVSSSVLS